MSSSFSTNFGLRETLRRLTHCGFEASTYQMRCIVVPLTPATASHRQHSATSLGCHVGPGFSRQVNKLCRLHLLNKYSSRPNKYNSVNREALHECSSLLLRELIWKIFAILFLDLIHAPPRRGLFNSVPELIQDINQCSSIKILIAIRSFGPTALTTCYEKSFEPMIVLVLKRMKHSTGPCR